MRQEQVTKEFIKCGPKVDFSKLLASEGRAGQLIGPDCIPGSNIYVNIYEKFILKNSSLKTC